MNILSNLKILGLALGLALLQGPAQAQDTGYLKLCHHGSAEHWDAISKMLVGEWSAKHHAGYMHATGAGYLPFPGSAPNPITLFLQDGKLMASGGEPVQTVELEWADEGPWGWRDEIADGAAKPLITEENLRISAGCDINTLPRLIGRTQVVEDGTTLDFTMRLFLVTPNRGYGLLQVKGVVRQQGVTTNVRVGRSLLLKRLQ